MDIKKVVSARTIIIVSTILGVLILMLISFALGASVGMRKARFSNDFGKNYEQNFMGPRFGMESGREMGPKKGIIGDGPKEFFRDIEGRDFRNAHGLAGSIISITENSLVVKDRDNKETTVSVSEKTAIKERRDDVKLSDLKSGDEVVVIGDPNDEGVIDAGLIRVFRK